MNAPMAAILIALIFVVGFGVAIAIGVRVAWPRRPEPKRRG